jgi:ATPases of the AAA+ class
MLTPVFCSQVTHRLSDADLDVICEKTDGYSGSDMKHLVQEPARAPLRELFQQTTGGEGGEGGGAEGVTPSAMRPIKLVDFKRASKQVRPSVTRADIDFHEEWNRRHGAMSLGAGAAGEDDDDSGDEWEKLTDGSMMITRRTGDGRREQAVVFSWSARMERLIRYEFFPSLVTHRLHNS